MQCSLHFRVIIFTSSVISVRWRWWSKVYLDYWYIRGLPSQWCLPILQYLSKPIVTEQFTLRYLFYLLHSLTNFCPGLNSGPIDSARSTAISEFSVQAVFFVRHAENWFPPDTHLLDRLNFSLFLALEMLMKSLPWTSLLCVYCWLVVHERVRDARTLQMLIMDGGT